MIIEFEGKTPQISDTAYIAPTAVIIGDVTIGAGASIWFGAVVRGDYGPISIGESTSIQDNAVIHVNHTAEQVNPTRIGAHCTIGHGAVIEGCEIADHVVVGMNAIVLPETSIGAMTMVAAGSVVPGGKTFEGQQLIAGTPASIKRELSGPLANWPIWAAEEYTELAQRYRKNAE